MKRPDATAALDAARATYDATGPYGILLGEHDFMETKTQKPQAKATETIREILNAEGAK